MASFQFLHCADLHIDSPLRGLEADPDAPLERIRNATRDAFISLVDYAIEQQVAFVLAAGDLYDRDWQDWRTGQFLIAQMGRLGRAGIPFIAIQGNHDAASVISRHLKWDKPAHLFTAAKATSHRLPELEVCIHGQSFATRKATDNLARDYPEPIPGYFNIGLLHTSLNGRTGHDNYAPCRLEELHSKGYQYWALGHVHAPERHGPDPWVVFPGNLQGRKIGEAGARGAVLVTIQDGVANEPERLPFDTVRWDRLLVQLPRDAEEDDAMDLTRSSLSEALSRADGRLLAARVVLTGTCRAHTTLCRDPYRVREKVRAAALSCADPEAIWIEGVEVNTHPDIDTAGVRARADAVGLLAQAINNIGFDDIKADIHDYCRAMLDRSGDLHNALGNEHPVVKALTDQGLPTEFLERARDLLLAHLVAGE